MSMSRFACIALLFVASPLVAQDRVTFLDRASKTGGTVLRSGTINSEDPGKATITGNDNRRTDVPAVDLLEVIYDGEPLTEMNAARAAERERRLDAALAGYTEAMKKVPSDKKLLRRHLEYKLAELRAAQAEGGANPTQAIDSLRAFIRTHGDSRQLLAAYDLLGRLLLTSKQPADDVLTGLAQVRSKFGADNKEVASRCDLLRSELLLQDLQQTLLADKNAAAGKATALEKSFTELATIADRTIQPEVEAKRIFCQAIKDPAKALAAWDALLKSAGDDNHSRAAIHLVRGDYYRLAQQPKEAMWEYLWVDTVFMNDRHQQAKALYYLTEVFDKLGDTAKARDCKERLSTDPRLRDTRYRR
jgi:hypothetical protein